MSEKDKRLVSTWESITKNADGEAEIHELHKYSYLESEAFPPAKAARITPSRRKPVERPYTSIFVFSDAQIDYRRILNSKTNEEELVPIHDERALRLAQFICRQLMPDFIVNLGDTVDLAALSRFKPDSDHFHRTLGPSFQRVHDMYAQLRSDNPQARIVEVDSNHNTRFKDYMLKNMPAMYGVQQAGNKSFPVLSYPHLVNLEHVGVEWISGYGAATFEYADDLAFIHGTMAVSNASTASKLSKVNPDRNIVQGHAHRAEMQYRTNRKGKQFGAFVVGALCRTTGEVPSYHSAVDDMGSVVKRQEDWQQSVMHIKDYGNGRYQFDHILFHPDGDDLVANYEGKEYMAEGGLLM